MNPRGGRCDFSSRGRSPCPAGGRSPHYRVQEKAESTKSLPKGLPVISFYIGDSAEFVYGNERDVFIFGGKSTHIFHGPKALFEETNLRPGRLNLAFREY